MMLPRSNEGSSVLFEIIFIRDESKFTLIIQYDLVEASSQLYLFLFKVYFAMSNKAKVMF